MMAWVNSGVGGRGVGVAGGVDVEAGVGVSVGGEVAVKEGAGLVAVVASARDASVPIVSPVADGLPVQLLATKLSETTKYNQTGCSILRLPDPLGGRPLSPDACREKGQG